MRQEDLLAPCGLYCGVCGVLMAHRDNQKFKEKLAAVYGLSRGHSLQWLPVGSANAIARSCPVRSCAQEKSYEGCHQCESWPCSLIDNFPMPVGKKVIMRAIPTWRELGTEKWVEQEIDRYHCPHCDNELFRGAKRCRSCKEPVDQD
jgi:hypothetical protein